MTTKLKNIELLRKTGRTNVCIIDYSWKERRASQLQSRLAENGFRAWFANDMDELMKLNFKTHISCDKTVWKKGLRLVNTALYCLSGKLHSCGIIDAQDTLFLVSTLDTVICEAVQSKLNDIGAADRLFLYNVKQDCIEKYPKAVLNYMEYHVAWHCNLKCKGCSHYCNLYDQPQFGDPEKFRKNLLRLHELFDNIITIRLMGGEPFLNPELGVFAEIAREIFPDTDLRVVSNGLLIPKARDEVLSCLKQNHVTVDISNYPPTAKMLDRITNRLKSAGIAYEVSEEIKEFRHIAGNRKKDATYNFDHCGTRSCHFLHDDGRLTVCGIPCFYDAVRDKLTSENEVSEKNWVDIFSVKDGYEILKAFNREIPFCTYCIRKEYVWFPWQGNYTEELMER